MILKQGGTIFDLKALGNWKGMEMPARYAGEDREKTKALQVQMASMFEKETEAA